MFRKRTIIASRQARLVNAFERGAISASQFEQLENRFILDQRTLTLSYEPSFDRQLRLAFCPTGQGGGVDNSCSSADAMAKSEPELKDLDFAIKMLREGTTVETKDFNFKHRDMTPKRGMEYIKQRLQEKGLELVPKTGSTITQSSRGGGQTSKAKGYRIKKIAD